MDGRLDRDVEQDHRHPEDGLDDVVLRRPRRDSQQVRSITHAPEPELLFEALKELGDIASRVTEPRQIAWIDTGEPKLAEGRCQSTWKAGEPGHRGEVAEGCFLDRLEAYPCGNRLRAERRGRRHAEPRHLRGGKAHGELRETRAVQPEGRGSRRRDLPG